AAVLVQTTIRGPLLGFGAAALTFAVASADRARLGRRELIGFAALVGVAFALALTATGGSGIEGLRRFALIAQGSDSSVERLTVWRDAIGLPLHDALRTAVGFGPETQAVVFERAEATVRLGQNQQWDRAHNLVLDAFLSGGMLGVL